VCAPFVLGYFSATRKKSNAHKVYEENNRPQMRLGDERN
jgi:hypothetical protein